MKNTRDLLEKEILNDAKNGDTTVLAEILASLSDEYVFASLSDKGQESLNFHQLKGGELIESLVDTNGVSNSYNTPEHIEIKKGTILKCGNEGTRFGDAFTKFVSGNAIKHCRGYKEGQMQIQQAGDTIGLRGGYNSAAYSLGQIDLRIWKIVSE
jgi:hypothetical protein